MVKLSIPFVVAVVALNIAPIIAVPISAGNDLEIRDLEERGILNVGKKVFGAVGKVAKNVVNKAKGALGLRELEGDNEIYTRAETTTADLEIRDLDALETRAMLSGGSKPGMRVVKGINSKLGLRELEGDSEIYTRAETTPADLETRDLDELETRAMLSGGLKGARTAVQGLKSKLGSKLGPRELEGDSEIYTRALTTTADLEKSTKWRS